MWAFRETRLLCWQGSVLWNTLHALAPHCTDSRVFRVQAWPILGIINECSKKTPFAIGLFSEESKQKNINEFYSLIKWWLHGRTQFYEERKNSIDDKKYQIRIFCFICDAPARYIIKNTKFHTGYSSCERCVQRGCSIFFYLKNATNSHKNNNDSHIISVLTWWTCDERTQHTVTT